VVRLAVAAHTESSKKMRTAEAASLWDGPRSCAEGPEERAEIFIHAPEKYRIKE
jgi:hypothetical protein